jgi:hypothetical protein
MSTDLASRIHKMRAHADDVAARIADFKDARSSASLRAIFDADKQALRVIRDADIALDALSKEALTISCALEQAEALLKQEHHDEEHRERRALALAAHQAAEAVAQLNIEIDAMLKALREAFERRQDLLGALAKSGVPDPTYVAKLAGKLGPTRAACAVGLHKYLDIQACSPVSHLPLTSTNPQLIAIGLPPEPTSPPRATKRKNGGDTQ